MDFDQTREFQFNHRSGNVINPKIEWQEPLQIEIDHFVDCILTDKECLTGVEHAETVIEILSQSQLFNV